jgi:phosphopantothenoylcysteine decarboxylase/phosphopantothenate--cysteine ligase
MWAHPATVAAVTRLQEWGVTCVPVGVGRTACGEVGEGRLAEPAVIVAAVEAAACRPARRWRVLVTAGGTTEPIDGIRVLTNTSTGATGAGITAHLRRAGHEVVFLHGRAAVRPAVPGPEEKFGSFAELDAALGRWLGGTAFDAVIHAAAVSDFGVEAIEVDGRRLEPGETKLDSSSSPVLRLKPYPKLLDGLRSRSTNPRLVVVAFKLTRGAAAEEARRAVGELFQRAQPDFVVHNDLAARAAAGPFPADIFQPNGSLVAHCADRGELGPALATLLTRAVPVPFVLPPNS